MQAGKQGVRGRFFHFPDSCSGRQIAGYRENCQRPPVLPLVFRECLVAQVEGGFQVLCRIIAGFERRQAVPLQPFDVLRYLPVLIDRQETAGKNARAARPSAPHRRGLPPGDNLKNNN